MNKRKRVSDLPKIPKDNIYNQLAKRFRNQNMLQHETPKVYICVIHNSDTSICNIYGCSGITSEQYKSISNYNYNSYFC